MLWDVDSADSLGANYLGVQNNVMAGFPRQPRRAC